MSQTLSPSVRLSVIERYRIADDRLRYPNLVHPGAVVDMSRIELGKGNMITAGCVFTVDIEVGDFNLFNLNVTVGHDVRIASGCVINPSVNISGGVVIGNGVLVGTGAQVLEGLAIGDGATIEPARSSLGLSTERPSSLASRRSRFAPDLAAFGGLWNGGMASRALTVVIDSPDPFRRMGRSRASSSASPRLVTTR
jgi:carbonic anhydrase/acetyltransferase-like protein (isoleucine patch superfamily)